MVPPAFSRVNIRRLMGETPAAAFDFAGSTFHVPTVLSAPNDTAARATTASNICKLLFIDYSWGSRGSRTDQQRVYIGKTAAGNGLMKKKGEAHRTAK